MKSALALFAVTAIAVLVIGGFYNITREPIALQQAARERELISILLPGTVELTEEDVLDSPGVSRIITGLGEGGVQLGYVVFAQAPGYGGPVEIMAGFNANGTLTGVQVLRHRETPGLGTGILLPNFLNQFAGRENIMTVSRNATEADEIQALSSATISTAAVVNGINAAIEYVRGR